MPKLASSKRGPITSRPYMPGYDMMFDKHRKSLPWSWASDKLRRSHNHWLVSIRPNGGPHTMPVWGVWLRDSFFFSTGIRSRKSKNLQTSPRCIVLPEGATEAVILEGSAEKCSDRKLLRDCM